MFDVYSHSTEHARLVAWMHPRTLPTWPDAVRQDRDADIDARLFKTSSENVLSLFAAGLSALVGRWWLSVRRRPAERSKVQAHYLPVEHRAPANR